MAISGTYQQLQKQIADELGDRQDLLSPLSDSGEVTAPIANAIQSAIAFWERENFYFLQSYATLFNTVAGQEFYTGADGPAIATAPSIVILRVLVNGQRYPITKRTWQYIEQISTNPLVTSTYPADWAYFAEQIRLYPIPSQAMPVQASFDPRLAPLANPTDSNVWTQDAYDLIRCTAQLIIAREVIKNVAHAEAMRKAIYGDPADPRDRGYLTVLKNESTRRARTRIRPSSF